MARLEQQCEDVGSILSATNPRRQGESLGKPEDLPSNPEITEYFWPPFATGNMAALRKVFPGDRYQKNPARENDHTIQAFPKIFFGKWEEKNSKATKELGFLEMSKFKSTPGRKSNFSEATLTTYNEPKPDLSSSREVSSAPPKAVLLQTTINGYSYLDVRYMKLLEGSTFIPKVYKALRNPDMAQSYTVTEHFNVTNAETLLKGWVSQGPREPLVIDPLEAMKALGEALKHAHGRKVSKGSVHLSDLMPRRQFDKQFTDWALVNWGESKQTEEEDGTVYVFFTNATGG